MASSLKRQTALRASLTAALQALDTAATSADGDTGARETLSTALSQLGVAGVNKAATENAAQSERGRDSL